MKIQIREDFKSLIPPLSSLEFTQLEENCISEGIREKIIIWQDIIIDGHNRYKIAQEHNLPFETESKDFGNEDSVKEWMILNQFGRRNLSNYQRSVLALELEGLFREKAKENIINENKSRGSDCQISDKRVFDKVDTKKELSKIASVSHDTIAKVKKIQEKAPEEVKEKLNTGEVSINQAYQEIKKVEKKENFERKQNEFNQEIKPINTKQKIILGDSREVLKTLQPDSFDLLLSDPPYGMDFKSGWSTQEKIENDKIEDTISLFEDVLKLSTPLLKDDAHFYLFGNINFMPQIKPIIEKYLTLKNVLIWDRQVIGMGDLKSYGNSYDVVYFGFNKTWKDLNGTRDRDLLSFKRVDPIKNIHPTEKPIDILEYLIKKSSNESDNILEPFAGGGSTLVACKTTNRIATGIEIEKKYFELIKSRI